MELDGLLTQPTQGTQSTMDPRRMGRNNSGLAPSDVSDVMCILHPSTPAAFQLVIETARRSPQHILQDVYGYRNQHAASPSMLEEEETFILEGNSTNQALDLALRFSSRLHRPALGFVVGRNMGMCDIAVSSDVHKRVSNMHFSIYMNESGVLMLKDMSTNGTMVDEVLLKGRNHNGPKQRMLNHGSIVQILSPSPTEALKFIVRIPSRVDFMDEYEIKFSEYIERQVAAVRFDKQEGRAMAAPKFSPGQARLPNTAVKAPIVHNSYGMHWNGGETYNVVGQIGKGAFASVYQLATKADGQLFAAKELEKRKFMKNGVLDRKLENEMHIMQQIEHASIVQYHEYQDVANHLYIIMEYVPCGDLQQYLTEVGPLDEPVAKQMATQVFDALDYLHHKRITHRDIKPDNILIGSRDPNNFIIKLSDFGLSKVVKDNDTFLKTFCGTLLYCAPEVFPHYDAHVSGKGTKRPRKPPPQQSSKFHSYSQAVDIWSFGAVLWYSLCHRPPFEGVADNTGRGRGMFDKIMMTPLDAADLVKQGVSDEAVALLVSMLNTDPAARPSAEDCLRHDWFGERFLGPKHQSQPVLELEDIEEDVEAEAGADRDEEEGTEHPDVAALSLDERGIGSGNSDLSINSSDMNFFDPRKSKRFKTNEMDQREEEENFLDSSPELLYDSIPIVHQPETEQPAQAAADRLKPTKLFGEISQSDLQGPAFNMRANDAVGNTSSSIQSGHARTSNRSQQSAQQGSSDEFGASPSLFGAESMVRDMNMDSVNDSDDDDDAEEPATPESEHSFGELSHHDPSQHSPGSADIDPTPRPPQPAVFNRQIHIPVPPSFYFDPADQSTHTLEYASKASGRDFAAEFKTQANGSADSPEELTTQSLPGSAETSRVHDDMREPDRYTQNGASATEAPEFLQGDAGQILGRLVSTSDSFERIVLDMKSRDMSWGRSPGNTYIYQKELDTRIPRTAVLTFFYADGIKDVPQGDDITQLPGLYTGILTHGSNGLRVNGVQLDAGPEGKYLYGQLHTGDVIEVFPGTKDGKRGLWFRAEIYHGKGKTPRPKDGPRFKVEQQKQPKQEKQPRKKEKKADVENAEKENHAEEAK